MSELFDAVDALLASRAVLPPPAERKRLRAAHGLTIDEVATALKVRRATVSGWESGKTEPRPPERDAYARLLDKLAELYPAVPADTATPDPRPRPCLLLWCRRRSPPPLRRKRRLCPPARPPRPPRPLLLFAAAPAAAPRPARTTRPVVDVAPPGCEEGARPAPRRPAAIRGSRTGRSRSSTLARTGRWWRTAPAAWSWTCLPSPCPARWWYWYASGGQARAVEAVRSEGRSADPLQSVLTEAACERYGLPVVLVEGGAERRADPGGPHGRQAARAHGVGS
ncbi:hypothetical protein Shyd_68710 [Streptomyces hydrogenans]|uniref:HTH cro/C1-type domain-containing protein n=2 Tax=Streptomyces hydrogenans TaxID=1873719 RepID=A0ABQ3PKF3_9ACTN|nr:hypothetical protein Shyd_68710 [Streptomyces hydrogenans]